MVQGRQTPSLHDQSSEYFSMEKSYDWRDNLSSHMWQNCKKTHFRDVEGWKHSIGTMMDQQKDEETKFIKFNKSLNNNTGYQFCIFSGTFTFYFILEISYESRSTYQITVCPENLALLQDIKCTSRCPTR